MADEPAELMDTYEALRIVEMFVKVAEESDNPDAASPPQRDLGRADHGPAEEDEAANRMREPDPTTRSSSPA